MSLVRHRTYLTEHQGGVIMVLIILITPLPPRQGQSVPAGGGMVEATGIILS